MTGLVLLKTDLPYIYRWNREGRKGEPCRLLVRGKMNSILVEFADGHQMVTSVNAIRTNRHSTDEVLATHPSSGAGDVTGGSRTMRKVTVYQYMVLDTNRVELRKARRWGTREAIDGLKDAEIIGGSASRTEILLTSSSIAGTKASAAGVDAVTGRLRATPPSVDRLGRCLVGLPTTPPAFGKV